MGTMGAYNSTVFDIDLDAVFVSFIFLDEDDS